MVRTNLLVSRRRKNNLKTIRPTTQPHAQLVFHPAGPMSSEDVRIRAIVEYVNRLQAKSVYRTASLKAGESRTIEDTRRFWHQKKKTTRRMFTEIWGHALELNPARTRSLLPVINRINDFVSAIPLEAMDANALVFSRIMRERFTLSDRAFFRSHLASLRLLTLYARQFHVKMGSVISQSLSTGKMNSSVHTFLHSAHMMNAIMSAILGFSTEIN